MIEGLVKRSSHTEREVYNVKMYETIVCIVIYMFSGETYFQVRLGASRANLWSQYVYNNFIIAAVL